MAAIRMLFHALIPLGCLAAATARADEPASRWTFGTQVGVAKEQGDSRPRVGDVTTMSYDVSATFGDKSRIGWRVFTGYRFNNLLAVQVGYTDLGKVESGSVDLDTELVEARSPQPGSEQTVRGIDVGLQLKVPLGERVAVDFRGGKYYWQSRTNVTDLWGDNYRFERRDADLFFGAGMEVALTDGLSATLGWTRYDVGDQPVALWTIGTLYRFSVY